MFNFLRRERIYILIFFFILAVNMLNTTRTVSKPVEEKKTLSSMTFKEIGITEEKVKDYLSSGRPSARFFRYGAVAGASIFILSLILNVIFILFRKRPVFSYTAHRSTVSWDIGDILRAGLIIVFLSYLAASIEGLLFRALHINIGLNLRMMLNTFVIDIAVVAVVIYFVMFRHKERIQSLGLNLSSFFRNILSGITAYVFILPLLLVILILSIMVLNLLGYNPPPQPVFEVFMEEKRSNMLLFLAAFVSVFGPIVEEIFFRGFMYSAVKKRLGILSAVFLSTLIFSFLHTNIVGFLPIMVLGALLAYLYEVTGSLVPSITVHIIHNSIILGFVFFIKELMT